MRILACGDIVGRSGRKVFVDNIADLRRRLALDFVVVNGENAAHGFGITEKNSPVVGITVSNIHTRTLGRVQVVSCRHFRERFSNLQSLRFCFSDFCHKHSTSLLP